jgi:hypothetical protein
LGDFLKGGQAKSFERKDLDPKWDSVFWFLILPISI